MANIDFEKATEVVKSEKFKNGLRKYNEIMNEFYQVDVSSDEKFQKCFKNFYKLQRRSEKFVKPYFEILEQMKNQKSDMNFDLAFNSVYEIENHCEISFSSKLAHTINPTIPIWDSIVTGMHFNIKAPYLKAKNRNEMCQERYHLFETEFYQFMFSNDGQMLVQMFDDVYPDNKITDVKKIDFVLWQYR